MAVELAKLRREKTRGSSLRRRGRPSKKEVVVIGASIVDFTAKLKSPQILVRIVYSWVLQVNWEYTSKYNRRVAFCINSWI